MCTLLVDTILHLPPPPGPKGRMYGICIYIYSNTNSRALISLVELTFLAIIVDKAMKALY